MFYKGSLAYSPTLRACAFFAYCHILSEGYNPTGVRVLPPVETKMAKTTLIVFLSCITVCKYVLLSAADKGAEYEESENTDYSKENQWPLRDLFDQLRQWGAESWERFQLYNNFEQDWQTLKLRPFNPTVLGSFLGNTTMPAIYTVTKSVKQGWIIIYKIVMDFTKRKCDRLIGPDGKIVLLTLMQLCTSPRNWIHGGVGYHFNLLIENY